MRVLLVEDDRELAEYVRKGLEEEGYIVHACFDGVAGLKAAEITVFDIVLLDVMLPFLDGFQVTRRLRLAAAAQGRPRFVRPTLGNRSEISLSALKGQRKGLSCFTLSA
jgi:DNA-binding response OmpR family regulator